MGKSIGTKRKRQFYGNRFKNNAINNSRTTVNKECSASSSKLAATFLNNAEDAEQSRTLSGNRIIDMEILMTVFNELCCPKCFAEGLIFCEDSRYGLCSNFLLKCKMCDFSKGFSSSEKHINAPEINTRLVYGLRQLGKGFSSAYKLCSTLNLPSLSKTAYVKHERKLTTVVKGVAEKFMKSAASDVATQKQDPTDKISKCGVSVDGTWQRRGYTSLNGCVSAISVDTGKVIDIEIMSSYCPVCKKLERMPKNIAYTTLKFDHVCQCNFEGSASKMEVVGASRMFRRSIEERKLQYAEYYGDGDSKAFVNVKDTYGQDSVVKLECIGHVQKRVGSRLRKLKSKTKGISGKGKLTDAFIDRLQNYYGIAVRSNIGNLDKMQQSVISALFHCASNCKKPMHGQCPVGKDSWCYYQRSLESNSNVKEKYAGLPNYVLNTVKPTYLQLCSRELLSKCLHGKTQNANESFNGIIWQRVPKNVFVCLKTLKLGAYDAVIQFNEGFKGSLAVLSELNIENLGYFTLSGYNRLDKLRIAESVRHSTPVCKKRRKIVRALKKKKICVLDQKEGKLYESGGF